MNNIRISRQGRGKSLLALPENYTIVDIETTGLSPLYDEIIELAGIKVREGVVVDEFQQLIRPSFPIPHFIVELTGISNEMVENAPDISEMIGVFTEWIGNDVIVGHNVFFDINFLFDAFVRHKGNIFSNDCINTVRIAKRLIKGLRSYKLSDLCCYYNIKTERAHRALCDCMMTNQLFNAMKNEILEKKLEQTIFTSTSRKNRQYFNTTDARLITSQIPLEEQNPLHPLYKKIICITGTLAKHTRDEAMQMIANVGGFNSNSVTKKTDYLVLGSNDYNPLIKDGKSSKHKKAERYASEGTGITILDEYTFYDLLEV